MQMYKYKKPYIFLTYDTTTVVHTGLSEHGCCSLISNIHAMCLLNKLKLHSCFLRLCYMFLAFLTQCIVQLKIRLVTQALTLAALERAHHPVLSEEQQQCGLQSSSTISSASVIFSLNLRFIKFMILEYAHF